MALRPFWRRLLKGSVHTGWAALVLLVLAWAVYGPSLNRVFASDQIHYLAELNGRTSFFEGLRHYDYAATRRYWKGDDALFRPLLFTWLAIGNRLFSYHHVWWNIANLAIHVLVALFLFRLLIAIRPSPFALAAAALFLVLKPPMELVLWNHLGGYMLACLFLAIGLRAFVRLAVDDADRPTTGTRAQYAGGFAAASLCHEAMVLTSALTGMLLLALKWRRARRLDAHAVLVAALPVLLFAVLYGFHIQRVARLTYVDRPDAQGLFGLGNAATVLPRSLSVTAKWTIELATPSATTLIPSTFGRFVKSVAFSWTSPLHLFNALLALTAVVVIGSSASRRYLTRTAPLLVLVAGAMVAYAAVVCFGRAPDEVAGVTYYPYIFGFLLVIFAYSLVDFSRLRSWTAATTWLVIIALNAVETTAVARESERVNHYPSLYLNRVIRFVDAHKPEPGFSFMIQPHPETIDPAVVLIEGYPNDPRAATRRLRLTEILFGPYYDQAQPMYVLDAAAERLAPRSP